MKKGTAGHQRSFCFLMALFPRSLEIVPVQRDLCLGGEDMDKFSMDRFVNQQNLEIFRQLASSAIGETERKILLELLAEQEAEFAELQKARSEPKRGETANKDVIKDVLT
ncbi:MAG: hypothetical protein ACYC5H_13460 [Methylovirgula sp.]